MQSKNQKILITGATGAIGSEIALKLAGPGRKIVLHFRKNTEKAQDIKSKTEKSGSEAFVIASDISETAAVSNLVSESIKLMGGLDILVHAVAIFERTPFGEVTEDEWERIMGLDLKSAFFLAQTAGLEIQRKGGKMIFLSDVAGAKPYAGYLPYCIAKAGIDALVRGLAKSLAPKVQVNAIAPYIVTRPKGISDSGWNDLLSKTPMRRASSAREIAAIVKLLVEDGETITGQIIAVDGGRLLR